MYSLGSLPGGLEVITADISLKVLQVTLVIPLDLMHFPLHLLKSTPLLHPPKNTQFECCFCFLPGL